VGGVHITARDCERLLHDLPPGLVRLAAFLDAIAAGKFERRPAHVKG
jgi:hypothetical protein